jgi:hypothetical protein
MLALGEGGCSTGPALPAAPGVDVLPCPAATAGPETGGVPARPYLLLPA